MNPILWMGLLFLGLAFVLLLALPFSFFAFYVIIFGAVVFVLGLLAQWKLK